MLFWYHIFNGNHEKRDYFLSPQKIERPMKKWIVTFAIAFAILTINAQSLDAEIPSKAQNASVQDDYKEVSVSNLPQAIKDAVAKDLEDAVVTKAYANEKGEFKLVVTTGDKLSKTLFANSKGQWIKEQ